MADEKNKTTQQQAPAENKIPDFILEIFEKQNLAKSETPRANVIIAASYVDDLLTKLLKKVLVKPADSQDKLFDEFGALYNFGTKVELAYRMGQISSDFAWVLHRIRKLRDECAHSHEAKDFNSGRIKDLIDTVYGKTYPNDKRQIATTEKFENIFTMIYLSLWTKINGASEVTKAADEFETVQ